MADIRDLENIVIVGSGPAGYTAALYASRANLNPLLIDGPQLGGQLSTTTDVENYPGFPKGIQGPELMELMRTQAERFGTRFYSGLVSSVDFTKKPFTLTVDGEVTVKSRTVIISTGASALYMGLPSEAALLGFGVSACATCDGAFFKGKEIAVVGGGDTAMEEATFLTRFASKVTVIHRRDKLRASKIMQEKAMSNPKIKFVWDTAVTEVKDPAKKEVSGLVLKNLKTGAVSELPVQGFFLAIGHKPNTDFLKGAIALDEKGYVTVHENTRTSVEGVFAGGDCVDHRYRQAVTAAGMGCMAAMDAEKYLEEQGS